MSKFGLSQPVRRKEDARFLTGAGGYIDDVAPKDAAHVVFVRSPIGHGRILSVDADDARAAPGVVGVLIGAEIEAALDNQLGYDIVKNRDGSDAARPRRPLIAVEKVVHVGEIVAAVAAGTLAEAKDAAELVVVDYEDLPCVTDTAAADGSAPVIHPEAPGNRAFDWVRGDEAATEAAFAGAAHHIRLPLIDNRVIAQPMETRGVYAEMQDGRLHVAVNGQGPWGLKGEIARRLRLDEADVRVTHPDVGGGFGMKAFNYPEQLVIAHMARAFAHPIRWIAERTEGALTDVGGRDHVTFAEAAFDAGCKLLAYRITCTANLGAHCSGFAQFIPSELAVIVSPGVYDVQTFFMNVKGVFTNTTPIDAYRGAGRPEAIYLIERLMDISAREIGIDPLELRRRNFIPKDAFPYKTASGELYDVGDFNRVLDAALAQADYAGFPARKAEAAARGRMRGLGVAYYIESILGDQNETTKIEFAEDGMVNLYVGTQSNGQGHETVFAQFLNQRAGVPFEKIRLVQGDTDRVAKGGGTGGSRSVTMQGSSINVAADEMIEKFRPLAEEELETSLADIVFEDGAFRVAGTDRSVDMMTLGAKARETGRAELLVTEKESTVPGRSYPNGCHIAEVEVDPETGVLKVVAYSVVDDFGVLMNPVLAEGQVHGGVVQGIGQAVTEHVVYDEDGQLLSASFMDYAMPRADDAPMIPFSHEGTPSTANSIGMKGCGEAGTVGALAAVTNAGLDALWDAGVRHVDMPMTPLRVWSWLRDAGRDQIAAE